MSNNYQAWQIEKPDFSGDAKQLYRTLAGWASLAASSHNVQPWKFILKPSEGRIDICLTGEGVLPESDKDARQSQVSIGCALENLLLAIESSGGHSYQIEYHDDCRYPKPLVTVRITPDASVAPGRDVFEAMKQRSMNRAKYDPVKPVPEVFTEGIRTFAESLGLKFSGITDKATRIALAEIQYTADKAVILLKKFRNELGGYLLPNDTDSGRGMPGKTFGLGDAMAQRVHNELLGQGAFDPDLAAGFASSGRDGIKSSPFVGIVSVAKDSAEERVKAGRVLEHAAVLAAAEGLGFAVHAAMTEVGFFTTLLKARLGMLMTRPTVIFRIGYPTEQRPHSPRVPVDDVVEFAE